MFKQLNVKDSNTAESIMKLQRASYKIEAELIGYDEIPPLQETLSDLQTSTETFYGYFLNNDLVGLISFKVSHHILDIHRMAVHPNYFRKGIANNLLHFIESLNNNRIRSIIVSTGKENKPAINLYLKNNYTKKSDIKIGKGTYMTVFEKNLYENFGMH